MTATDEALLTVDQVAERLTLSTRQVYRLTDAGKMPKPLKIGHLNRWNPAILTEWIAAGCKPIRTVTGKN